MNTAYPFIHLSVLYLHIHSTHKCALVTYTYVHAYRECQLVYIVVLGTTNISKEHFIPKIVTFEYTNIKRILYMHKHRAQQLPDVSPGARC